MADRIRNIKNTRPPQPVVVPPPPPVVVPRPQPVVVPPPQPVVVPPPRHRNQDLEQRITANGNRATLSLNGRGYTDRDMEIVADMLKNNTVSENCSFSTLRFF